MCIGHSGHSRASYTERPHTLAEQVAHKLDLVRHFIRDNPQARVVLAGHSVGAYIALELLRDAFIGQHVARVLCLFPTVHHIGTTPNGRRLYPLLKYFRGGIASVIHLISHLPESLQRAIAAWHMKESVSEKSLTAALKNIEPRVVYSCMLMGMHEMEEILHIDQSFLRTVDERLTWYFGATDGWVTMDHAKDVQAVCGRSDVHFCQEVCPALASVVVFFLQFHFTNRASATRLCCARARRWRRRHGLGSSRTQARRRPPWPQLAG